MRRLLTLFIGIMGKVRVGNKQNSFLNREWAVHVRRWGKKFTASKRRATARRLIKKGKQDYDERTED